MGRRNLNLNYLLMCLNSYPSVSFYLDPLVMQLAKVWQSDV